MKNHLPNSITLLNLASGCTAMMLVIEDKELLAIWFVFISLIFDFLDGFLARLLKVSSEMGKQLDSLADLVSFGLVPSAMIFKILFDSFPVDGNPGFNEISLIHEILLVSVLIVPLMAAIRLARFNLQKTTDNFMGLSTPAFAIFWTGIYYDFFMNGSFLGKDVNHWFYWGMMILSSLLMVVGIPMMSLKFKNFKIYENGLRYLIVLLGIIIIILTGFSGLPVIILIYILLSLLKIILVRPAKPA